MSEIDPQRNQRIEAIRTARDQMAGELAACYARVFLGSDDGMRVLADLRMKFGVQRLTFSTNGTGRYDAIGAALVDGERRVMVEIENALLRGAPSRKVST